MDRALPSPSSVGSRDGAGCGDHDEPYTFEKWLNIYSAHIPGHIEQIRNNYKIWKDTVG